MKRLTVKFFLPAFIFLIVSQDHSYGQADKKFITVGEAILGTYDFWVDRYDSAATEIHKSVHAGALTICDGRYSFVYDSSCFAVKGLQLPKFYFLYYPHGTYTFTYYGKELSETTPQYLLRNEEIIGAITLSSPEQKTAPFHMDREWYIRNDFAAGVYYFHALYNDWSF